MVSLEFFIDIILPAAL